MCAKLCLKSLVIDRKTIEELIVAEVAAEAYHPRTSKHSDNQSLLIIRDLIASCPLIAERAAKGQIVAQLRHNQQIGFNKWVIDIALGTPAGQPQPPNPPDLIRRTAPALIQVAIELKSIWTEHGKARHNRLRDFDAFQKHAFSYNPKTISAAFLVVNAAENFLSPLNLNAVKREPVTRHGQAGKSVHQIVNETINIFRSLHLRNTVAEANGLDALGVVVIEHDNFNYLVGRDEYGKIAAKYKGFEKPTRVAPIPPNLRVGDPLHYNTMLQRICVAYNERFR
jgi:hypothetical protein